MSSRSRFCSATGRYSFAHFEHGLILVAERNQRFQCASLSAILALFARRLGLFAEPLRTLRIELLIQPIKVTLRSPTGIVRVTVEEALIEYRRALRVGGLQIVRLIVECSWSIV